MKRFSEIKEGDVLFVYIPGTKSLYLERVGIVNQVRRSITTHYETYNFDLDGWACDCKVKSNGLTLFTSIIRCLKYLITKKYYLKYVILKKGINYKTINASAALSEVKTNPSFMRYSFTLDNVVTSINFW